MFREYAAALSMYCIQVAYHRAKHTAEASAQIPLGILSLSERVALHRCLSALLPRYTLSRSVTDQHHDTVLERPNHGVAERR